MVDWKILVAIDPEAGSGCIGREASSGTLLLAPDPETPAGIPLEGFEPTASGDPTLAGGVLPPGAIKAELIDKRGTAHAATCANGAWIVSAPLGREVADPAVRFRDADGEIVRRPLRVGATTEFWSNVIEPCPACGGKEWEVARWPWVDEEEPQHVYLFSAGVCCRCGHAEKLGGKSLTDERPLHNAQEPVPKIRELFASAPFSVWGLGPTWSGSRCLASWSVFDDRLSGVGILHRDPKRRSVWVRVHSSASERSWAPHELTEWAYPRSRPHPRPLPKRRSKRDSEDEEELARTLRMRKEHMTAAKARHVDTSLWVGRRKISFALVGDDRRWAAVAELEGSQVTVSARNVAPGDLRLSQVKSLRAIQRAA